MLEHGDIPAYAGNELGLEAAKALASALLVNRSLQTLNLEGVI